MPDRIVVHGAREHDLQNIDAEIPREKLVVTTGLSGSGKSSLAFDTSTTRGAAERHPLIGRSLSYCRSPQILGAGDDQRCRRARQCVLYPIVLEHGVG